jgi:hypothetical protein
MVSRPFSGPWGRPKRRLGFSCPAAAAKDWPPRSRATPRAPLPVRPRQGRPRPRRGSPCPPLPDPRRRPAWQGRARSLRSQAGRAVAGAGPRPRRDARQPRPDRASARRPRHGRGGTAHARLRPVCAPARLQVASRLRGCWPRAARVVVGRGLPRVAHAGARIDLLARGRRGCSWTAFAQCDFHCGRRYDNVFTLVRWRSRPPSWCSDAYKGRVICPFAIIKGGLRPIAIMAMCFATLPVSNNGSQI